MDYAADTADLLQSLTSGQKIRNRQRQQIIERIDDLLQEMRHSVRGPYMNIAEHLMKWVALPAKRSNSWRRTISRSRDEILLAIKDGGVIAKYAKGTGEFKGHRITPEDLYAEALARCSRAYTEAYPAVSEKDARALFTKAVPSAMSLHELIHRPIPITDLPDTESKNHAEL